MASQEAVKSFKEHLARITKFKADSLVVRSEWGAINFEVLRTQIHMAISLAEQFDSLSLDILTDQILGEIQRQFTPVAETLERIDKFRLDLDNPSSYRQTVHQDLYRKMEELTRVAAIWMPFLICQSGTIDSDAQRRLNEAAKAAEERVKGIDKIIKSARDAAQMSAAAVFAEEFNKEANTNEAAATQWLRITGVLAFGTVLIAIALWWLTEGGLEQGVLFQKISTKLVILGLLLSATVWCGRNYKAMKHLAIVNRHRVSCIRTMEAFNAAAKTPEVQDMVLREVTKAAFSHAPTGFVGDGNSESDMQIVEVARSIVGKDKA